ncbi:DUF645 family protein [Vibrio cholerae]
MLTSQPLVLDVCLSDAFA